MAFLALFLALFLATMSSVIQCSYGVEYWPNWRMNPGRSLSAGVKSIRIELFSRLSAGGLFNCF